MSKKVRITSESYQVIGFHGMKYSFGPVFGYLLGTEKAGNVEIQKSFPVSHNTPLAPLSELSAEFAEKQNPSLKILGVYYGSEVNTDSTTVPLYVERIAQNIKSVNNEAVIIQLKANNITDNKKSYLEAMNGYKIETLEDIQTYNNTFNDSISNNHSHRFVNDFEDFLNSSGSNELK